MGKKRRKKKKKFKHVPVDPRPVKLAEMIRKCSCGHTLTRKPGQTAICLGCGAEWDGFYLRLPKGLPPEASSPCV